MVGLKVVGEYVGAGGVTVSTLIGTFTFGILTDVSVVFPNESMKVTE